MQREMVKRKLSRKLVLRGLFTKEHCLKYLNAPFAGLLSLKNSIIITAWWRRRVVSYWLLGTQDGFCTSDSVYMHVIVNV